MGDDATRDHPTLTAGRRIQRIRFRAWRRGFKEADLIMGGFADAHARDLSAEDLERFEALLEEPDHDLYAWIALGDLAPTQHEHALLERMRAFCRDALGRAPASGS